MWLVSATTIPEVVVATLMFIEWIKEKKMGKTTPALDFYQTQTSKHWEEAFLSRKAKQHLAGIGLSPIRWEASGKSERHVIKGLGFFLPQGVHGGPWRAGGGARVAAKQSLIIDQLSDCRRNLARAGQIARWGSLTIWDTRHSFHFKLPSDPALWKWNSFMTTSPSIRDQNLILQVWWGRIWGCGGLARRNKMTVLRGDRVLVSKRYGSYLCIYIELLLCAGNFAYIITFVLNMMR